MILNSPFPCIPSWLPLTALIVYRFGNNLGLGPLPWLINGEMFSEEAKGVSSSIVTITHWTSVFFVTRYATNLQVQRSCTNGNPAIHVIAMSLVSYEVSVPKAGGHRLRRHVLPLRRLRRPSDRVRLRVGSRDEGEEPGGGKRSLLETQQDILHPFEEEHKQHGDLARAVPRWKTNLI